MHTLEAIGSINKERFSRACFGRCQSDGGSLRVAGVDRLDDEASSLHSDGVQIRQRELLHSKERGKTAIVEVRPVGQHRLFSSFQTTSFHQPTWNYSIRVRVER